MSNAYYQDELRYLREVGPEFANAHPEIARFLADRGSDPDVERILEGVAFLCGRIREKLDDDLPELTASMMSLLWPHYLRPIPSMTIIEFLPDIEAMQGPLDVERGAEFASIPVDDTKCRYRSAWPTKLRPWVVESAKLETAAAEPARLVIRLRCAEKVSLDKLGLDSIRFHLFGDPRTAFTLYLLLSAHVDSVIVSDGSSSHKRREMRLGPEDVVAAGLDRADAVLPYPAHSFAGYRLLQEYFAFKERFLFVDVLNVDRLVEPCELTDRLELSIVFNRHLETWPIVARDNVRLHCVPAVNLFTHPADPVRLKHDRTEYLILPSRTGLGDRRHAEVYSVDQVAGLVRGEGLESRVYEPFYSFRHMTTADARSSTYYQTRVTPNVETGDPRQGTDTYVSFVVAGKPGQLPSEESISIELTCTNRDLPTGLRAGDISQPTDTSPAGVRFRNLLKPTATVCPPLGDALHWRLISHMSLNYVSLSDVEHFRELLRVYDFQAEHDAQEALAHQRLIDGIIKVECRFAERLIRGAPVRGSQIDIELNEDHFAGEGDALLFAGILDRFMGLYASINAYTQLTVRFTKSGQLHEFPPRWGEQRTPANVRLGA